MTAAPIQELAMTTHLQDPLAAMTPEERQSAAEEWLRMLGMHLRAERKRRHLTQQDIAEWAGRTKGWVSQIENGMNDSNKAAKLYCMALGLEYSYLVAMAEHSHAGQMMLGGPSRS